MLSAPPPFLHAVESVRTGLRSAAVHGGLFRVFCRGLAALVVLGCVDYAACRLFSDLDGSIAWRLTIFGLWLLTCVYALCQNLVRPLRQLPSRKDIALRLATEEHLERMWGLAEKTQAPCPAPVSGPDAASSVSTASREMSQWMDGFTRHEDLLEAAWEFATVSSDAFGKSRDSAELRREVLRQADRLIPEGAAERFFQRNLVLGFREYLLALAGILFLACIPFALAPGWTSTAFARVLFPSGKASWNVAEFPDFDPDSTETGFDPNLEAPMRQVSPGEPDDTDFDRLTPDEAAREMDRYLGIVREELDRIVKLQQRNREEVQRLRDALLRPAPAPGSNKTSNSGATNLTASDHAAARNFGAASDSMESLSRQALPLLADQREIRRLLIDPTGGLPRYLDRLVRIVDTLPEEKAVQTLVPALRTAVDELDVALLGPLESLFGAIIRGVPETSVPDTSVFGSETPGTTGASQLTDTVRGLKNTTARIADRQRQIEDGLRLWEERVRHLLDDVRLEHRWTALLDIQYDVYSRSRGKMLTTLGLTRTELSTEALDDLRNLAARQSEALDAYRELLKQLAARDSLDRRWEPRLLRFRDVNVVETMGSAVDDIRFNHLGTATRRQAEILTILGESPERLARWQDLVAATGRREGENGAVDPDADDAADNSDGMKSDGDTGEDEQLVGDQRKQLAAAQGDTGEQVESDREGAGAGDGRILDGNAWLSTGGGSLNPMQKSDLRKSWGELLHRETLSGSVPREEILPEYREETLRYFQRLQQP